VKQKLWQPLWQGNALGKHCFTLAFALDLTCGFAAPEKSYEQRFLLASTLLKYSTQKRSDTKHQNYRSKSKGTQSH